MKSVKPQKIIDQRKRLGLNQSEFWAALGVTQSGGSRYEAGRRIPKPVMKLYFMAVDEPDDRVATLQLMALRQRMGRGGGHARTRTR